MSFIALQNMKYFSWLHLTDLHHGMKAQRWLWPEVKDIFFTDLQRLHDKCGPWDLVLFTGDLTQRGSAEEFRKLDKFFERLWKFFDSLGFNPRLLAVPGNHDLMRPDQKEPAVKLISQWQQQQDIQTEFWEDAESPYRQVVAKAFANYTAWQERQAFKPKNLRLGILPGDFSVTIEKAGAKLGVVGLNTAFLQLSGGDYEKKLALHARQFHQACGGDGPEWARQHQACLFLTHHPPTWLDADSRQHLQGEITAHGRFAVHLCGHMHEAALQELAEGGGEARRIWQGRSLFGMESFGNEKKREHGYTAGKIELSGDKGILQFWPREARLQGGQRNLVQDLSLYLTDEHTEPKSSKLLRPCPWNNETATDQQKQPAGTQNNARHNQIPLHRPPRAQHFIGRQKELEKILNDLLPGQVVTLCGPGGMGKTALAAEAVWKLAPGNRPPERFPDGIVFHSFYNQSSADMALEHIARAYGMDPLPSPKSAAQNALNGKTALLVLDGAEDADDLRKVQAVAGGCGMLVTSREKKDAIADRQDMNPLEKSAAVKLLREWAGEQTNDEKAVERICELTGCLPLAIRLAGRYMNKMGETAAEYVKWIETARLEEWASGECREENVPVLLERSLAQVSQSARDVLALIGLLALAPVSRNILEEALKPRRSKSFAEIKRLLKLQPEKTPDLRTVLEELIGHGLLQCSGGRCEVTHALIHTYARERLKAPAHTFEGLVDWFNAFTAGESTKGLEGYKQLHLERPHLLYLLDGCMRRKAWEAARSLVWAMGGYLSIQGFLAEWRMVLEKGIEAARASGSRHDEGAFLGNLGNACRAFGQIKEAIAHYKQALAIAREIGDQRGEANRLNSLGNAFYTLGQMERAITHYKEALAIARETGRRQGEGNSLNNLGNVYRDLGQAEKAIAYYEQALAITRKIAHRQTEGSCLSNLGLVYSDLGQVDKAIAYYEQALAITQKIGYRQGEGYCLGNLGNAYRALGQTEKAIEYYNQALAIDREIGYRQGEGADLDNLGLACHNLGQSEKALAYLEQALAIAREVGYRQGEGDSLMNLGTVYKDLDQLEKARELWTQSLKIYEEIKFSMAEQVRGKLADLEKN